MITLAQQRLRAQRLRAQRLRAQLPDTKAVRSY
jgi:hypothetical protein